MRLKQLKFLHCICLLFFVASSAKSAELPIDESFIAKIERYCFDCHDEDVQKGDIRLDELESLDLGKKITMLNAIQEQVFFKHMPPKKKKKQPTESERKEILDWMTTALKKQNAYKLEDKINSPDYANYVDHGKLFSGDYKGLPGYTKERTWLISEHIFTSKTNRLFKPVSRMSLDGKRIVIQTDARRISDMPFLSPKKSGIHYYSNEIFDSSKLATVRNNADLFANFVFEFNGNNTNDKLKESVAKIVLRQKQGKLDLSERINYMTFNSAHVFSEIYKDKNQALLPEFKSVTQDLKLSKILLDPSNGFKKLNNIKKANKKSALEDGAPAYETKNFSINIAEPEFAQVLYKSVLKAYKPGISKREFLTRCEKEWFYHGFDKKSRLFLALEINKFGSSYMMVADHFSKGKKLLSRYSKITNLMPAAKPLSKVQMKAIREAILKHRKPGDTYKVVIEKCRQQWQDEVEAEALVQRATKEEFAEVVKNLFEYVLLRVPSSKELNEHVELVNELFTDSRDIEFAVRKLCQAVYMHDEFVHRLEYGSGEADQHGRRMLRPIDAAYAISFGLTESEPDDKLIEAAKNGKLQTREDYEREVTRILSKRDKLYVIDHSFETALHNTTKLPIAKLRFFREFFGYHILREVFKDEIRFGSKQYEGVSKHLLAEADMLVEHILKKDENVFEELLTTEEFFVHHNGDSEIAKKTVERHRKIYEYFKDKNWQNFTESDLVKHKDLIENLNYPRGKFPNKINEITVKDARRFKPLKSFKDFMETLMTSYGNGGTYRLPLLPIPLETRTGKTLSGISDLPGLFNLDITKWEYPAEQPFKVPHRKGILTHPAWLIAHSQNDHTDPVKRGKWVREKLLAGTVPDIPITVDAQVPKDPHKTLRERFDDVTMQASCYKCHIKMNPLGYPFEVYDDFGRFRTVEAIEHKANLIKKIEASNPRYDVTKFFYKTLPVNPKGYLEGTDDQKLDGEVKDAFELIDRLAKSDKVRQSIIRHAFRYFMGRNERLSDSKTLMDAEQAYLKSGGSFDAVIVSLFTSDSFIYRKKDKEN